MVDRSDSLAQCDAAQALSERAGRFQQGAKRIYDSKSDHGGDMWFFELFHFLGDVQSAFRSPAVQERLASPGSPERTAELQYEAGMYESLYLAWKERAERAEAQVENMRLCLQRIVDTPVKKSFDYDKFGEIKNGSNSYDERWSAWHFQELARSAITSTVRTGKVCGYHDGCPPDKIPCHLCAHVQPAEGGK
jgi:hypothetical protein